MELNKQPIEHRSTLGPDKLEVVKIWETIQGEGPLAGSPAVFIRLAGCNLLCPLCDTDYTSERNTASAGWLAKETLKFKHPRPIVVITGGEPFRQDLSLLVANLVSLGRTVQIETNGTLFPTLGTYLGYEKVKIVCSPKTAGLHRDVVPYIDAWKYVVQHGHTDPADGLPTSVLGKPCRVARCGALAVERGEVFVQPLDEQDPIKNKANLAEAVNSCLKFGYRLCLQVHKIAELQ